MKTSAFQPQSVPTAAAPRAMAEQWMRQIWEVCQRHQPGYYPRFKAWADEYFYLLHRQETRGVGGLFFDRLTVGRDGLFEEMFAFVQDVGEVYGHTYSARMRPCPTPSASSSSSVCAGAATPSSAWPSTGWLAGWLCRPAGQRRLRRAPPSAAPALATWERIFAPDAEPAPPWPPSPHPTPPKPWTTKKPAPDG